MITKKEIEAIKLSPTKKDFYQIWMELLDTAGKISDRWDPKATNESDPGIVLLKVATALADKLNYNIDKNILEAFMPSAAQEESMRKLCEMMGYNVKYYQSALAEVTVSFKAIEDSTDNNLIFNVGDLYFTNSEKDIKYVLVEDFSIPLKENSTRKVKALEGELIECENNSGKLITINLIDDNKRYYLPEATIAENGIFIWNATENNERDSSIEWKKVDNLNTYPLNTTCYKFGYDSTINRPYIQFPEDISLLIGNGLLISYIRTNGLNGNISRGILTEAELKTKKEYTTTDTSNGGSNETKSIEASALRISNNSSGTGGANIETIRQAYNNYKKTIGTFDTLVTCRDYMNKIYSLLDDTNTHPLVSNIIVSDIRDDINNAITICTFNDFGISYLNTPRVVAGKNKINTFDLVLYPFKKVYDITSKKDYNNSFKYSEEELENIKWAIEDYKTIAHNITSPQSEDIVCIKNYLKLNAKITTTYKVNAAEELLILTAIRSALFERFNMRELDFGEEIPFDDILDCIEKADTRIKNVALEEPELYTKVELANNKEYNITDPSLNINVGSENNITKAKELYNKLALRNILAGRVPVFKYNEEFEPNYFEAKKADLDKSEIDNVTKIEGQYQPTVKVVDEGEGAQLIDQEVTVRDNEVIQFRAPNYKTILTYPAYVNYNFYSPTSARLITAGTEYQLLTDELLIIEYTPSSSETDEETPVKPIIKVYRPNEIIKPNFDLKVTNGLVKQTAGGAGKTASKVIAVSAIPLTDNIGLNYENVYLTDRSKYNIEDGTPVIPFFSLDQKEQIEIRKPVEVSLPAEDASENNQNFKLYLLLKDSELMDKIDEVKADNPTTIKYEFKEDEYLFYTDLEMNNLSYYGSGTELSFSSTAKNKITDLINHSNKNKVSLNKILDNGIEGISWSTVTLSKNDNFTLKEYKYVTLTKGDKLNSITLSTNSTKLSNEWINCTGAEYNDNKELPVISIPNISWQVRSKLEFNCGPKLTQTLTNEADSIIVHYIDENTEATISGPISFKTNYLCQTSSDTIRFNTDDNNTSTGEDDYEEDDLLNTSTTITPKIRLFEETQETYKNNITSYKDNWYKVTNAADLKLNVLIPSSDKYFGLIAIYYKPSSQANAITTGVDDDAPATLRFYGSTDTLASKLTLEEGLNIIQVTDSCSLNFSSSATGDTIVISKLDLVEKNGTGDNYGINLGLLKYYNISAASEAAQLVNDIRDIETSINKKFYWNCPIKSSTALDFKNEDDNLTNSIHYYDYNNINNKFVISEIDTNYLKTGLSLTRSSKL